MFCLKGDFSILIPAHPCSVRINILLYWSLFRGSSWFSCYVILGLNCWTRSSRPILLWRNIFHRFAQLSSKIGSKSLIRPVANSWDEFKRSRDTRERNPFSSELGSRTKKKNDCGTKRSLLPYLVKKCDFLKSRGQNSTRFCYLRLPVYSDCLVWYLNIPNFRDVANTSFLFFFTFFFVSLLWH